MRDDKRENGVCVAEFVVINLALSCFVRHLGTQCYCSADERH